MGNASFVFFSLTYFMFSKYLQLKPRTIERQKQWQDKYDASTLIWEDFTPHPSGVHMAPPPHPREAATCLASPSAGGLWKGTAPRPAGRLPQKTAAAPSASCAGCVPFPGPSGCARPLVPLRKQ